jgi:hypothetical protein
MRKRKSRGKALVKRGICARCGKPSRPKPGRGFYWNCFKCARIRAEKRRLKFEGKKS